TNVFVFLPFKMVSLFKSPFQVIGIFVSFVVQGTQHFIGKSIGYFPLDANRKILVIPNIYKTKKSKLGKVRKITTPKSILMSFFVFTYLGIDGSVLFLNL